ncbi:MAG: hypothetical protein J3K34DRAFT_479716 [Monoraphidium minutum]|nr:MAG: hypothetical protein J3K34DRAFT_479716 [Monoraphidium minutum]
MHAQLDSLTFEFEVRTGAFESLRSYEDALGAVVLSLEGLIAATRLLTCRGGACCGGGGGGAGCGCECGGGSGCGCECGGGSSGGAVGSGAATPELPWWVRFLDLEGGAAAAAARFSRLDAPAVAARVQAFVHRSSVDLFRLAAGAADAPAAAQLAEQLGRLMALSAGLLATRPQVLAEVGFYDLDTLKPYEEPPPPGHWAFVIRQAQLSRRQELAAARLLALYRDRLAALQALRAALLARQEERAADVGEQAELLAELERTNLEYVYTAIAFPNALYAEILQPRQAAGMWVAAFPFVPQLLVLGAALEEMAAARAEEEAADARAAAAACQTSARQRRRRRPRAAAPGDDVAAGEGGAAP